MKASPRSGSDLKPSAFAEIAASVSPSDTVDLARINPNMPPSPVAVSAMRHFAGSAGAARYADSVSNPSLCEAIAVHYEEQYAVKLDPASQICIVPGTRFAIMALASATAEAGDEILLPDPGYPDYVAAAQSVGAVAVSIRLGRPINFQPDWNTCPRLSHPALLFLNYPSNPCGVCAGNETFSDAVAFARQHGCWLAHDLAYGAFCYDGRASVSILQHPDAVDVAVEMWSASKNFGLAGWRIGAVVGNPELVERVNALVELNFAAVWPGFQIGLTAALAQGTGEVRDRVAAHEQHRDVLVAALNETSAAVSLPEGGMSIWCQPPRGLNSRTLLRDYGVAAMAGDVFGASGAGWLRLALSLPHGQLNTAATRLRLAFDHPHGENSPTARRTAR
jgi:aminotransferase